jgi:hypothetical protein
LHPTVLIFDTGGDGEQGSQGPKGESGPQAEFGLRDLKVRIRTAGDSLFKKP